VFKLNARSLEGTESSPKASARPRRRAGLRKLGITGLMVAAVAAVAAPAQAADDPPGPPPRVT
jgi:hypothetical protein